MCIFRLMKMQSKLKEIILDQNLLGMEVQRQQSKLFKSVHGKLDYIHNLAQISMDGPNVNWKIVEMLH